jgi:hypothetical protein
MILVTNNENIPKIQIQYGHRESLINYFEKHFNSH